MREVCHQPCKPSARFSSIYARNIPCYFGWFGDLLIDLIGSLYLQSQRPIYVQSPICVRVCSIDLGRIAPVLMHILIQPPSSYKSSFSYKTSDSAETHDPSTHVTHQSHTSPSEFLCCTLFYLEIARIYLKKESMKGPL
jgi:hypothetical protein